MNLKNEINSRFMGDRSRLDLLAELTTKEVEGVNHRIQMLENAISVMQEAMVRIENAINSIGMVENEERPKKPRKPRKAK